MIKTPSCPHCGDTMVKDMDDCRIEQWYCGTCGYSGDTEPEYDPSDDD